jgi:tRNA(Ile)-lysidine synthase
MCVMPRREPSADAPLTALEVAGLFRPFEGRRIALAVSGGLDSTVLMHLVAQWLGTVDGLTWRDAWFARSAHANECHDLRPVVVLTVDHALRAGSAQEAAAVGSAAAKLGFPHRTLVWHQPTSQDPLPADG